MEQVNNGMLAMLQAMSVQTDLPKPAAKGDSTTPSEFQKLLDQKTQSAQTDRSAKETAPAEKSESAPKAAEEQDAPQQEDAQTMAKRLVQAGLVSAESSGLSVFVPDAQPLEVDAPENVAEIPSELGEVPVVEVAAPQQVMERPDAQAGQSFQDQPEPQPELPQTVQPRVTQDLPAAKEETPQIQTAPAAEEQEEPELEILHTSQASQPVFENVKAAPIKVGEAPMPEQTESKDLTQQVSAPLLQAMEKGESTVKLQLTPESLGTVTVEITRSGDGALHVALSAQNNETRGLLERHSGDLQAMLARGGQENVQVEVQRQQESQQHQDNPYDGHNGQDQSQQQQQQQRRKPNHGQDFIQQLRLGLIPMDGE